MSAKRTPAVVGVNGACGRMGLMFIKLIAADESLKLGAAIEVPVHPDMGKDAGTLAGLGAPAGVALSPTLDADIDVMIDFSLPEGTMKCIDACVARKAPMVIGTTGLDDAQLRKLSDAAKAIPIVFAPNMSVGVNLLFSIVGKVAAALGEGYDCEIVEMHHRFKKDAPSGTALALAEKIAEATGRTLAEDAVYGREGKAGERTASEIGIHAVRGGDVVGEHTVSFSAIGERVELTHKASSRETFARGGLRAAKFLLGKPPGLYSMLDVLGL